MSEKIENTTAEQDANLAEAIMAAKQEIEDAAEGRAAQLYHNVRDIQMDFAKRNRALQDSNEKMSEKEFTRWEDAVTDELKFAEDETKRGKLSFDQIATAADKMVAYHVDTELHKTVEAQAGNFYYERDEALRTAIREQGGEDAERDLTYLNDFYPVVATHLDFKYMTPADVQDYGADEYERNRTKAHNDAIRHLNGINDLAHKYGTRPFTARNFWTSDLREKRGQTPAMARVMRYDRDIVEEYYAIAFSSEVRQRENKMRRNLNYGF